MSKGDAWDLGSALITRTDLRLRHHDHRSYARLVSAVRALAGRVPRVGRGGMREPTSVHLVLTGPGGGTWDIPIGHSPPASAPVGIVTDAVGFCWLVANRATPDRLGLHITGDPDRVVMVLAMASALALD